MLRHVFPASPVNDGADALDCHAIHDSDGCLFDTACYQSPDFYNVSLCQMCISVLGTSPDAFGMGARSMAAIPSRPAFSDRVLTVIEISSEEQVAGANAARNVTPVQALKPIEDRAKCQCIGNSMGLLRSLRRDHELPVTLRATRCSPEPAWPEVGLVGRNRAVEIDLGPETFGDRCTLAGHREAPLLGVGAGVVTSDALPFACLNYSGAGSC